MFEVILPETVLISAYFDCPGPKHVVVVFAHRLYSF